MGIVRHVFDDARNLIVPAVVRIQRFAQRIFRSKIFARHGFCDNHAVRFCESGVWVAL